MNVFRFVLPNLLLVSTLLPALSLAQPLELPRDPEWDYSVRNHPAVLLQTNYYVYGKRIKQAGDTNFLHSVIDPCRYDQPVTRFLYWENRETGERYYLNENVGFSETPIDLYGDGESLAPEVITQPVSGMLLSTDEPGAVPPGQSILSTKRGHYMWCFEIRDATGTRLLNRAHALYSVVDRMRTVSGSITGKEKWSADDAYLIEGRVTVEDGATLTIEPGTFVFGSTEELSLLNVRPGGRIIADGKERFPIVFTSELPFLQRSRSDWGGLVISGDAPVNQDGLTGEGDTGTYGGNNPFHDGGILRYVRVEFSGRIFSATNELNGLTFQGCGNRTTVEYIQVHQCSDDGIEFFGGTVNARNILVSGCGDDSLDWNYGYRGKLQNIVLMQLYNEADCGIEGDNHPTAFDAEPRSNPSIYNATFLGLAMTNRKAATAAPALRLRRGSGAEIHNSIFVGFGGNSVIIESEETADLLESGQARIANCIFNDNNLRSTTVTMHAEITNELLGEENNNQFYVEHGFASISQIKPNLTPLPDAYAANPESYSIPPEDEFLKALPYIGGIGANSPEGPWIFAPWTNFVIQ